MDNLAAYIATAVVSLTVGLLLKYAEPKAKLVYWSPHNFLFRLLPEGTKREIMLQTDALTVQNLGRKPAEAVEVIMTARPDFFQFAPAVPYEEEKLGNNQYVLRVKSLGPKEVFTLQLLSYLQVPTLLNLRSNAGPAERIPIQTQRLNPMWFNILAGLIFLVGLGFAAYWLVNAVIYLSKSIGVA